MMLGGDMVMREGSYKQNLNSALVNHVHMYSIVHDIDLDFRIHRLLFSREVRLFSLPVSPICY